MSTPRERIEADLKEAMKARDTTRVSTLRMLLTSVKNDAIAQGGDLEDQDFVAVVRKAIKQRRDSAEQYRKGDRAELAEKEEAEITVLEQYMPEQASEDEIRAAIEAFVADEGLSGPQAMGQVMQAMMSRFQGTADGSVVSKIARDVLAS